jgi:hypothetical protein
MGKMLRGGKRSTFSIVHIDIIRASMPTIDDHHKHLVCSEVNILQFSRTQHLASGAWGVSCLRCLSRFDTV